MDSTIDLIDRLSVVGKSKVVLPWDESVSVGVMNEFREVLCGTQLELKAEFVSTVTISDRLPDDVLLKSRVIRDMRVGLKASLFNDTLAFLKDLRHAAYKRNDRELLAKADAFEKRIFADGLSR